jgi:hypothetical protein
MTDRRRYGFAAGALVCPAGVLAAAGALVCAAEAMVGSFE